MRTTIFVHKPQGIKNARMMIAIYYDKETADEVFRHEILFDEKQSPVDVLDECWQWLNDVEDERIFLSEIKIKLV